MKKFLFLTFLFPAFILSGDIFPSDYNKQQNSFKLVDYHYKSPFVPRIFMQKMPLEIKELKGKKRIALFIQTVLPLVLLENENILAEREQVLKVANKETWTVEDMAFIKEKAYKYRIIKKDADPSAFDDKKREKVKLMLDHKIRPIPAPIALGQAALESGWGTSRFVKLGNNIFGHVSRDTKKGIKPLNWSGKTRHIKIFESLGKSIAVYMLNLNRNRAYYSFRQFRRYYPGNFHKMAEGFVKYSRIKEEYTGRLQLIIRKFRFYRYGIAKLDDKARTESIEKLNQVNIY
jgi:Bax protein